MNSTGNTGAATAVALSRGPQKRPRKSPTVENVSQGRPRIVQEIMKHGRVKLLNIVEIKARNILVVFLIKLSQLPK